jgi:hypothetical protein
VDSDRPPTRRSTGPGWSGHRGHLHRRDDQQSIARAGISRLSQNRSVRPPITITAAATADCRHMIK